MRQRSGAGNNGGRVGGSFPLAHLALAAGILAIGFSAIFVKLAAVPGTVSAFYRLVFAGAVAVPLWRVLPGRGASWSEKRWVMLGGAFFAADLILWNSSLLCTSAATATLLGNAAPLWVGLGAWGLMGARLGRRYWLGLASALAGLAVLVARWSGGSVHLGAGDALALGASFFYAAYLLITQKARAKMGTVPFMALSVLSGGGVTLAACLVGGEPMTGYPAATWAYLGALGLVTHLGGWLAINYALGYLPAVRVSVSLLAQTLVTALLAVPMLGEALSLRQAAGGALVLAGIALVNLGPKRAPMGPTSSAQGNRPRSG